MYTQVLKDIKKAFILIKRFNKNFHSTSFEYSSIYPFTTEYISKYFKEEDIKDKEILTVCSSGDHLFNAMMLGAKKVDCFDINIFSKYYMYLKKAAIECLDYNSFIEFFMKKKNIFFNNNMSLNKNSYKVLRDNLNEETKIFWDYIFTKYNANKIRNSALFSNDEYTKPVIEMCNLYMNYENFQKLKKVCSTYNPKFYHTNIRELQAVIDKKYDTIYLSNIAKYIDTVFEKPELINYRNFILKELKNLINNNGKIFLAYIYEYLFSDDNNKWMSAIDNYEDRKKAFDSNEFKTIFFETIPPNDDYGLKDAVITYQKKN